MFAKRLFIITLVVFLTVALIACEGAESTPVFSPTASPAISTDTPAGAPTNEPSPTATTIPAATETAIADSTSDYASLCSELTTFDELGLDDGSTTYGQMSETVSAVITAWEAVDPPREAVAWHSEMLTAWQYVKAVFDAQPGNSVGVGHDEALMLAELALFTDTFQAEGLLPRETRNAMVAAGCLRDDATPDNHGNEQSTATRIAMGEEIKGELNYPGDVDYFVVTAEAGTSYQINLAGSFVWALLLSALIESLPSIDESDLESRPSQIALHDASGRELLSADLLVIVELSLVGIESVLTWEAAASGDYYISLGDWELGDYTLAVLGPDDRKPAPVPTPATGNN